MKETAAKSRQRLSPGRPKGRTGRPRGFFTSKLDAHRTEIEQLLNNGATKTYVAKKYGYTWQGLYAWLKKNNIQRITEGVI